MDEKHHVLRPNIYYATFIQLIEILIILITIVLSIKLVNWIVGFDIVEYMFSSFQTFDSLFKDSVIDYFKENYLLDWFLEAMLPVVLFLINYYSLRIDFDHEKIITKKGIIAIKKEFFYYDDITHYDANKDLGFLNGGDITLYTKEGKTFELNHVMNIDKASKFLDEIIETNHRMHLEELQEIEDRRARHQEVKNQIIGGEVKN